jgi:hypothetical protein
LQLANLSFDFALPLFELVEAALKLRGEFWVGCVHGSESESVYDKGHYHAGITELTDSTPLFFGRSHRPRRRVKHDNAWVDEPAGE